MATVWAGSASAVGAPQGVLEQPLVDRGRLVGGVVVQDEVQVQVLRHGGLDELEEPQELLVAVLLDKNRRTEVRQNYSQSPVPDGCLGRPRKTTIRVTATGIAVLGLTTAGAQSTFAAESPSASAAIESSWSYVPQFASAPALAQGKLVDSGGAPVSRATVILFPVPVKPRTGDKLTPLARTTAGASGSFTVGLPAERDALLTSPKSAGARNLLVMAFTPGGFAEWYYSLPAPSTSKRAGNAATPAGTGAASIPFAKLRVHPEAHAAQPSVSSSPAGCGITDYPQIANIPVVVGMREPPPLTQQLPSPTTQVRR
jgi:hypothetical protein